MPGPGRTSSSTISVRIRVAVATLLEVTHWHRHWQTANTTDSEPDGNCKGVTAFAPGHEPGRSASDQRKFNWQGHSGRPRAVARTRKFYSCQQCFLWRNLFFGVDHSGKSKGIYSSFARHTGVVARHDEGCSAPR